MALSALETTNNVQVAAHHWRPRFIANGIDVNDFDETVKKTTDWREAGPHLKTAGQGPGGLGRDAGQRGPGPSDTHAYDRAAWRSHPANVPWAADAKPH